MRVIALFTLLLLTGCSSLSLDNPIGMLDTNMLDTAPQSDQDVRYPEWGHAPQPAPVSVAVPAVATPIQRPQRQASASGYSSLEQFLMQNGIDYEVMPGNHIMVKLKHTMQFATGSAQLSSDSAYWLNIMSQFLSRERGIDIVIEGHTDNTGTTTLNDGLSVRRAQSVKDTLVRNNVARNAIFTRGYGESIPACTNSTTQGRACNRRVELLLIVSNN
ncbi:MULTISPECIES: OmpA family protein [Vibrio]|uniref:OmpA family protein n=1 Tax=Vibrio ostreae TaxID=2841925 RepID=A0A975U837_9VIBR|nr:MULTISPECIES: OmpA family protein [Vibrio]QXO16341.1 OmpA family protein [Vibrio ostreae]WGY45928.1 OmpA family protein [Vibrio sp. ABG19]